MEYAAAWRLARSSPDSSAGGRHCVLFLIKTLPYSIKSFDRTAILPGA